MILAERRISLNDLERLQDWVRTVQGLWLVHLVRLGEFPKTVLAKGMKPFGEPIE